METALLLVWINLSYIAELIKSLKEKLCKAERWLHSRNKPTYFDRRGATIQKT